MCLVFIRPQAIVMFVQGSGRITIQLTVLYNTRYNVSIVGTLCGHYVSSTTVDLNYGESISLIMH